MAKPKSPKPLKISKETLYRIYPLLPRQGQIKGFYEAIGRAITGWQTVELSLREVLVSATAPQMPGALWAAFGAIHTAAAKVRVVGSAVRFICYNEKALLARWATLYNKFTDLDDRRNHFAHFAASIEFSQPKKDMRIILTSSHLDPLATVTNKRPPYTAKMIRDYEKKFSKLAVDLRLFALDVQKLQQQLQASRSKGQSENQLVEAMAGGPKPPIRPTQLAPSAGTLAAGDRRRLALAAALKKYSPKKKK